MLCNKQCKVGVVSILCGILIAVTVYRHDAVRVFVNDRAARVHAECAHKILKFFGAVDYLALVKLVGKVSEYLIGQLDAHAYVDAVRHRGDLKVM